MLIRQEELALARDKERNEHEFKMAELRQETERLRLENERLSLDRERAGSPLVALHNEDHYKGPKVPKFKEGETEIDAYLRTFEKLAHVHKWTRDTWATRLAPLLSGKAMEAYGRMSAEESGDYDKVKNAILQRYQLTGEAYRKKFRNCKQQIDETFKEC